MKFTRIKVIDTPLNVYNLDHIDRKTECRFLFNILDYLDEKGIRCKYGLDHVNRIVYVDIDSDHYSDELKIELLLKS